MGKILIIGGTGTLGAEVLKRYEQNLDVHVLSRGEHKQQEFKKKYPQFKFHICDIRDRQALKPHLLNSELVYHFAALKSIDICESNPVECFKTNVLGTLNIAELCIELGVKRCVFSSTDKAVDPISSYGFSKAMAEKMLFDFNIKQQVCQFMVFRWGNIVGSQGSVIPIFINKIKRGEVIPITHLSMTRFFIPIENAASYMLSEQECPPKCLVSAKALIPPEIKSCKIIDIVKALEELTGEKAKTKVIGIRGCEKLHESMTSIEEPSYICSSDPAYLMSPADLQQMLVPFIW